jgi:hypothetical protein
MSGSERMLIAGDVKIYFRQGLTLSGVAVIRVAPGVRLQAWSGGAVELGGQGVQGAIGEVRPDEFVMFGLPSCTSIRLTAAITGVIYAPSADIRVYTAIITGSCIAESVTLMRGVTVHFDEALRAMGFERLQAGKLATRQTCLRSEASARQAGNVSAPKRCESSRLERPCMLEL